MLQGMMQCLDQEPEPFFSGIQKLKFEEVLYYYTIHRVWCACPNAFSLGVSDKQTAVALPLMPQKHSARRELNMWLSHNPHKDDILNMPSGKLMCLFLLSFYDVLALGAKSKFSVALR